jgi:uncharacterized membrane protein
MAESSSFEMRRLEALSNTVFGVAMTLLAYDLPRGSLIVGAPDWAAIRSLYGSHLVALLLSFIVAGVFWLSQHRRLAYAPEGSRFVVIFNLLFLLSIVLLPVTTSLYGTYMDARDVVVLYATHLLLISALNAFLWLVAVAPRRDWPLVGGAAFSTVVFVIGLVVSFLAPRFAKFIWPFAFVGLAITSFLERKTPS